MPDTRTHRGPHPKDHALFAAKWTHQLNEAVSDYSWLLSRGYSDGAALKLVGDRFQLAARQRMALSRAGCSDSARAARAARRLPPEALSGRAVAIDGFNCLITVEVALSGGVVLLCRDGAHRDLASVHGTYRHVSETMPALAMLSQLLAKIKPSSVVWFLDSPVSNSGKLAALLRATFTDKALDWQVELVKNADLELARADRVAASSDRGVLDAADAWVDLPGSLVQAGAASTWLVNLSGSQT